MSSNFVPWEYFPQRLNPISGGLAAGWSCQVVRQLPYTLPCLALLCDFPYRHSRQPRQVTFSSRQRIRATLSLGNIQKNKLTAHLASYLWAIGNAGMPFSPSGMGANLFCTLSSTITRLLYWISRGRPILSLYIFAVTQKISSAPTTFLTLHPGF